MTEEERANFKEMCEIANREMMETLWDMEWERFWLERHVRLARFLAAEYTAKSSLPPVNDEIEERKERSD